MQKDELSVELFIAEGRAGKETGSFQVVRGTGDVTTIEESPADSSIPLETDAEAASRKMLEELRNIFMNGKFG